MCLICTVSGCWMEVAISRLSILWVFIFLSFRSSCSDSAWVGQWERRGTSWGEKCSLFWLPGSHSDPRKVAHPSHLWGKPCQVHWGSDSTLKFKKWQWGEWKGDFSCNLMFKLFLLMKTSVGIWVWLLIKMVWKASNGRSPDAVTATTVKVVCGDAKTTPWWKMVGISSTTFGITWNACLTPILCQHSSCSMYLELLLCFVLLPRGNCGLS